MKNRVVIAGALAQRPGAGGHTWVFLQYLLGFRGLGWDVLFLDQLAPEMCVDALGRPCPVELSSNVAYFRAVMEEFHLGGAYALVDRENKRTIGLSRQEIAERTRTSAFLLNVMGYLDDEEILGCAPRRVFLDIDPGYPQMWRELGLHDLLRGHDDYVTIGENVGKPDCGIPTCGLPWITTRPPVVLDRWVLQDAAVEERFTSIATWRGPYGPLVYNGKTYGSRVHEFRKFAELPRLSRRRFELALSIHQAETNDLALLRANEWSLVDPEVVAANPASYQRYIQGSRAEFLVAKNMYVRTKGGWFSDRSACYLASGRPVLAQDTGLGEIYRVGEGLLTFTTLDSAADAVDAVSRDYSRHARAARVLAEEYFDSDRVLARLVAQLGIDA